MKRFSSCLAIAVITALVVGLVERPANARSEYKRAIDTKYEKKFKTSCNTCHIKGKKKSERNDFGAILNKNGLTKKHFEENIKTLGSKEEKDKKALEDFKKALEKALKDPKNKEFKERLDAGKSPIE